MQLDVIRPNGKIERYDENTSLTIKQWQAISGIGYDSIRWAAKEARVNIPSYSPSDNLGSRIPPTEIPVLAFPGMVAHWKRIRRQYLDTLKPGQNPNPYHITSNYSWTESVGRTNESFETGPNRHGTRFRWTSTQPLPPDLKLVQP